VPHQQAMAKTPQKLHIKTFGCQMNAYNSELSKASVYRALDS
jgi:tRNA A37 methylthiotransferase MiaB